MHVYDLSMGGLGDLEIVAYAAKNARCVVTLDRDFTRILAATEGIAPSVIHLRMQKTNHARTTALLRNIVSHLADDLRSGCIVSVTAQSIRVRRLPIGGVKYNRP